MIARPTTDDLIVDCCRELTEHILPGLTDPTLQVRLVMAETVLRNAAVRAAHEIAWLRDETETLYRYALAVAQRHPSPDLAARLAAVDAAPHGSLHLADVVTVYEQAGRAFEAALSAAEDAASDDLVAIARQLLHERVATEKRIMATYAVVGR